MITLHCVIIHGARIYPCVQYPSALRCHNTRTRRNTNKELYRKPTHRPILTVGHSPSHSCKIQYHQYTFTKGQSILLNTSVTLCFPLTIMLRLNSCINIYYY